MEELFIYSAKDNNLDLLKLLTEYHQYQNLEFLTKYSSFFSIEMLEYLIPFVTVTDCLQSSIIGNNSEIVDYLFKKRLGKKNCYFFLFFFFLKKNLVNIADISVETAKYTSIHGLRNFLIIIYYGFVPIFFLK